ncbi:hypothetical protein ACFE04_022101 [Oxalis oulophora]
MGQKNSNLSSAHPKFEDAAHSKFEDDIENINQMLSRLEVRMELLLCKQTLSDIGFWYISRFAQEGGFDPTLASNDGLDPKLLEDVAAKLLNQPETIFKDNSPQVHHLTSSLYFFPFYVNAQEINCGFLGDYIVTMMHDAAICSFMVANTYETESENELIRGA